MYFIKLFKIKIIVINELKTIVLKFGGTSVGSIERIKIVSKIILSHKSKKTKVAVTILSHEWCD